MYQALYRKYRPRSFNDVVGQEHITETLRRQIISGRLSHAYLFIGTRGTGKTTCAKILSRAVNCLSPEDGNPCNKCNFCIGIEDGSILDVLELDAASNNSVDNVRALRDEAVYSPATVKKRVYIIDEVHMLSVSAFNALLKILEEPPDHILFILATTELHKVPATIQSRCQKFSFKRLNQATLAARLSLVASKEGLVLSDEAAARLAVLADGSARDAESLLDQCASADVIDLERVRDTLGLSGNREILYLVENIIDRNVMAAFSKLDELYEDGRDMVSLLNDMSVLFRDLLIYKLSPESGLLDTDFEGSTISKLSSNTTHEQLFFCLDVLKATIAGLSRSGSSKLTVELCIIKMCNERLSDDTSAMLSRLARLEAGHKTSDPEIKGVTDNKELSVAVNSIALTDIDKAVEYESNTPTEESDKPVCTDIEELPSEPIDSDAYGKQQESGCFWTDTLKILESDPSIHALLNDSSIVQAQQNDNILTILVADPFTAGLVETESNTQLIKEAAEKILGHSVLLRIEVGNIDTNESKHSKLESLSAFGIVNFEK